MKKTNRIASPAGIGKQKPRFSEREAENEAGENMMKIIDTTGEDRKASGSDATLRSIRLDKNQPSVTGKVASCSDTATLRGSEKEQASSKITIERALQLLDIVCTVTLKDIIQSNKASRHQMVVLGEPTDTTQFVLEIDLGVFSKLLLHLANHPDWVMSYTMVAKRAGRSDEVIKAQRWYVFERYDV